MLRQVGQAMAENDQKSEMDFRVFSLAARRKTYLVREARSLVDVHAQKEADGEQ